MNSCTAPTNFFPDDTVLPKRCRECYAGCATCKIKFDTCLTCISKYYLFITDSVSVPNTGKCVEHCPDNYYEDSVTSKCLACDTNCLKCTGTGSGKCQRCKETGGVKYFLDSSFNCVATCATNFFFADTTDFTCKACDPRCK